MQKLLLGILFITVTIAVFIFFQDGMDFDEFRNLVKSEAGYNSIDCGHIENNEDGLEEAACVEKHVTKKNPFFVSYETPAFDSYASAAFVFQNIGDVTHYSFDSDPSGQGRKDNGRYFTNKCKNPKYVGFNSGGYPRFFECGI